MRASLISSLPMTAFETSFSILWYASAILLTSAKSLSFPQRVD